MDTSQNLAAAVPSPQPSNTPCDFVCPAKDTQNTPLLKSNDDDANLHCVYGDDDHHCKYNKHTGVQANDHDNGHCPATATLPQGCPAPRRRRGVPRASARRSTSVLARNVEVMKRRSNLKRQRA